MIPAGEPLVGRQMLATTPTDSSGGSIVDWAWSRRPRPPARAALLALVLAWSAVSLAADPASAHSVLIAVSPKDGSTVATAPTRVVLTFNEAVNKDFSQIRVTDATGRSVTDGGTVVSGAVVSQALQPDLPPGLYSVVFKVVSADGHPISQQTTFTIAGSASSPPSASSSGSAPTSPAAESATPLASGASSASSATATSTTSGRSALPWVLGGLALIAVLSAGGLAWRRTRHPAH